MHYLDSLFSFFDSKLKGLIQQFLFYTSQSTTYVNPLTLSAIIFQFQGMHGMQDLFDILQIYLFFQQIVQLVYW